MKKITKYLLCLTLICTFCFALVGCSKEDTSDTNQSNQTDQTNDDLCDHLFGNELFSDLSVQPAIWD